MLLIKNVLFPTDRTAWSKSVFEHAVFYAGRHGARLHALTVTWDEAAETLDPPEADDAFRTGLRATAAAAGVELVEAERQVFSPDAGILDYAAEIDADLIVMATHGRRGLSHAFIGSVAESVVRRAACPVLTARPSAPYHGVAAKRILVPLDFSAHARKALAHARELHRLTGAELHLLHVLQTLPAYGIVDAPPEPHPMSEAERTAAEEALREIAAEVLGATDGSAASPAFHVIGGMGNPALDVLDAAARLDADLIVMATHGRTGVRRFFLGSVAEKVVQLAPCPVFTVKAFEKSLLPGTEARLHHETA
ncbi:MAG: universal stress protein [Rhodothermales bacterium]